MINRFNRTTYVILPRARGTWTISPYPGSATITSVKAANISPKERVTARVVGTGTTRTLVYNATKDPGTRLLFLEVLPDGTQFPILNTAAMSGRHRFRLETGSGYGTRKLRVIAIQGSGPTKSAVVASYRVARRRSCRRPATSTRRATSSRSTPTGPACAAPAATWSRSTPTVAAGCRRRSSAASRRARTALQIPGYPATPGRSVATVWALNSDGVPGKPRSSSFRPPPRR